ncbi:CIS tube protein [Undibacterium sp. SXout7W]|uniref:CIS tube protein n=1 Tax=Undibacterium sp. SXout7W TaxID=3413049 RepID=UPI003BEFDCC6
MTSSPVKLVVNAFSDSAFTQQVGTFTLQINPESYRHQHTTQYTKNDSTDTAGVTTKFYVQSPQVISFDFYLDATGIVPGVSNVASAVADFKKVAYNYNGTIHSPNYLQIVWGTSNAFNCRLTSLNLEYNLFKPDGTPLRAKLSVEFEQYLSPNEITQASGKQSPDMTHARTVEAGDTLPVMCYQIYGDSKYYTWIARFNKLNHFRSLKPGTTIYFPPLETQI